MADKITPKDLAGRKKDFVLIDVRESDEVEADGKIGEATNISLGQLIRNARQGALDNLKGRDCHLLRWAIAAILELMS